MEKICLLGATGSIGSSVLDVVRNYPKRFTISGVSGYKNQGKLDEIISEFHPEAVCLADDSPALRRKFPKVEFLLGESGLEKLAASSLADTAIIAVSGIAGLAPTLAAIRSGKRILSANKESIVAAGGIVNSLLKEKNTSIIPLDSEHNAIFNIFSRLRPSDIESITLTASGGPFLRKELNASIKKSDVLKHPTWSMGNYITVNSATMMNKGFEVIEAHYLFHMDYEKIKVLIHPQSLTHGIVETIDGSYFMLTSPSDMRFPIALSMFFPEIPEQKFPRLDLTSRPLEFINPDLKKFPLLRLAYEAGKAGGIMPAVLNAANETVVEAFLDERIKFIDIPGIVEEILSRFAGKPSSGEPTLEMILQADREARSDFFERY